MRRVNCPIGLTHKLQSRKQTPKSGNCGVSEALLVERAQPKTAQGMNCDRTIKTGAGRPQRERQICLRSLSKVCPNSLLEGLASEDERENQEMLPGTHQSGSSIGKRSPYQVILHGLDSNRAVISKMESKSEQDGPREPLLRLVSPCNRAPPFWKQWQSQQ